MKIILLSGGSGKRLWPLSNDIKSKQFLKLLRNDLGEPESMLQRVYRQIRASGIDAEITIATGVQQKESIEEQLGSLLEVVLEPNRRDTFPAIALAVSYLYFSKKVAKDEVVLVLPVDPYVDTDFFKSLKRLEEIVLKGEANIGLLGIEPTYPSSKYGYILNNEGKVEGFQEKPTESHAQSLIEKGAKWNSGVFAFKVQYLMSVVDKYIEANSYEEVRSKFHLLPKISFDYEVLEKEESITMLKYAGIWKDLGTWNTLTEVMEHSTVGNVRTSESCENIHVINELGIPIIALGVKDIVIAASPNGIIVTDKYESAQLKKYVEDLPQVIEPIKTNWGNFRIIEETNNKATIKEICVKQGMIYPISLKLEAKVICTFTEGTGTLIAGDEEKMINKGDTLVIRNVQRQRICAEKDLEFIEVTI